MCAVFAHNYSLILFLEVFARPFKTRHINIHYIQYSKDWYAFGCYRSLTLGSGWFCWLDNECNDTIRTKLWINCVYNMLIVAVDGFKLSRTESNLFLDEQGLRRRALARHDLGFCTALSCSLFQSSVETVKIKDIYNQEKVLRILWVYGSMEFEVGRKVNLCGQHMTTPE